MNFIAKVKLLTKTVYVFEDNGVFYKQILYYDNEFISEIMIVKEDKDGEVLVSLGEKAPSSIIFFPQTSIPNRIQYKGLDEDLSYTGPTHIFYNEEGMVVMEEYSNNKMLKRKLYDNEPYYNVTINYDKIHGNKLYEKVMYDPYTMKTKEYYPDGNVVWLSYFKNNSVHNKNGPARIRYDVDGTILSEHYYINGEEISDDVINFCKYHDINVTNDLQDIPDEFKADFKLRFC